MATKKTKLRFNGGRVGKIYNNAGLQIQPVIPAVPPIPPPPPSTDGMISFIAVTSADAPFIIQNTGIGDPDTWEKSWEGVLEYSIDKINWQEWNGKDNIASSLEGELHFRGTGNTIISGVGINSHTQIATTEPAKKMYCVGNIENLLDWNMVMRGEHPTMSPYCFRNLFYRNFSIISAPVVPATELAIGCYSQMFSGCDSLILAPELPATVLTRSCYHEMFANCHSLTKPPMLPATELETSCYDVMFIGCSSITVPPSLPATNLNPYCYRGMFAYCSSLATAPALPATIMLLGCYTDMFRSCTTLTTPPELPATALADTCYEGMFRDCTSLTTPPELPATTLRYGCHKNMFLNCTSLTAAPELPATTLEDTCYQSMFEGCTNLKSAPVSLPPAPTSPLSHNRMFAGTGLISPPALPSTELAEGCYEEMFDDCTSLVNSVALPATTLAKDCYKGMFRNTRTPYAIALPATTLAESCYESMFEGNTALTNVSHLPATTMATNCYKRMYAGCTGIIVNSTSTSDTPHIYQIPSVNVNATTATDWNTEMFVGIPGTAPDAPSNNVFYYIKGVRDYSFLIFEVPAGQTFTLRATENQKSWNGTLEYSFDTFTWQTWNTQTLVSPGRNIYLRGTGNTVITGDVNRPFIFSKTVWVGGSLETLLDWKSVYWGIEPAMATSAFEDLFKNSPIAQAPAIPMMNLASDCYKGMFYNCDNLTKPPALPATTLAPRCYHSMFQGCANITTVPDLPATVMQSECYENMFYNCANLWYYRAATAAESRAWRLPKNGTGTEATQWNWQMMGLAKGDGPDTPQINTTYYVRPL